MHDARTKPQNFRQQRAQRSGERRCATGRSAPMARIKEAFRCFDTDRSGRLSVEQMFAVLTRPNTGATLTDKDAYDLLNFGEFGIPDG